MRLTSMSFRLPTSAVEFGPRIGARCIRLAEVASNYRRVTGYPTSTRLRGEVNNDVGCECEFDSLGVRAEGRQPRAPEGVPRAKIGHGDIQMLLITGLLVNRLRGWPFLLRRLLAVTPKFRVSFVNDSIGTRGARARLLMLNRSITSTSLARSFNDCDAG